jgi:chemotaxis protein histidine kinase CheA
MKNIFIPLFYCLLNTLPLLAQTNCQSILTNARNAAAKGNYKEAIDKYTSAVDCDPNLSTTANNEIKAMFDKINKLKDDAIKAKNEVVKQKQIAQTQAENAKKAEEKAQKAQKQAEVEKQTALTAQKQAEIEKQNAEQANQNLKKTIAQVVLLQLQQVDKAILNLSYDTALVQTNRIADLGELPDSTLKRYQEIAYWYTETNQTTKP